MLGLVVDLGSIRMPQAGVGDEELNTALPSQEGEHQWGSKSPFGGAASFREAKHRARGAG